MFSSYLRKSCIIRRNFSQIKTSTKNGVKRIILCNEKTRNSLSMDMLKELHEAMTIEANLRCIVISSEGKVFSAGHNLKELLAGDKSYHMEVFQYCSKLMMKISSLPVPVLAQVNGVAAAAGCQLIASCDIVVASDTSTFITPGANFGIFCSTPGIPLVRNIPLKVAADMLLTGLPISAKRAFEIGLVSSVVPANLIDEEVETRVHAILAKSGAVITVGKKFMYEQVQMNLEEAYEYGAKLMVKNINMVDGQEGIRSFIEKRPPKWTHDID